MDITLAMLLNQIAEDFSVDESAASQSGRVRGIRLPIPKSPKEADILYVGKSGDRIRLTLGADTLRLDTDMRLEDVFNRLSEAFITLRDWDMNLHLGIIEKKGIQHLIDISEAILKNPVTFLDPGFKLVAYSHGSKSQERIYRDIIKKGYMAGDYVKELDVTGRLLDRGSGQTIFLQEPSPIFPQHMLISRVDVGSDFLGTISLVLSETPYSRGIEELFAYLRSQVILYFETGIDNDAFSKHAHASLLTDLINEKLDEATLHDRNRYTRLPLEGNFRLIKLTRQSNAPHSLYDYFERKLSGSLPYVKVFSLRDDVLILTSEADAAPQEERSRIRHIIIENDLLCGVSEGFSHLLELRHAFAQASAAIRLGRQIGTNQTLKKLGIADKEYDTRYFVYANYYPYHRISDHDCERESEEPDPEESLPPVFLRLLAGDQNAGTDNLRVLYAYLRNDCNKTHTAEALFMHRNNINYRIRRIEETLGKPIHEEPLKTTLTIAFLSLELIALEHLNGLKPNQHNKER